MNTTKFRHVFLILISAIVLTTFIFEMINGRLWLADFKVYYSAAYNFFSGEQVYLVSFYMGSGFYKYSPAILVFFLPYCFLSYKVASIIHFFILGIAFWYAFTFILKILKKYFFQGVIRYEVWLLSLSFVCILIHFTREMHLGNINIIMLLLCCQALYFYLSEKPLKGSLLLGLVLLAKPFYILLLIPLLVRKKWNALAWLGVVLAGGALFPILIRGFSGTLELYSAWVKTILVHGVDFPGMTSLDYLLRHHFFPAMPGYAGYIIMIVTCGIVAWFVFSDRMREQNSKKRTDLLHVNFIFEWFLILALLPVLFKTDWVQLMLSAPLITFMIFYISSTKKYWMIPIMVILLFFFGANSDDLLGRELSGTFLTMGLLGLSNFILVLLSVYMFLDFRKRNYPVHPE